MGFLGSLGDGHCDGGVVCGAHAVQAHLGLHEFQRCGTARGIYSKHSLPHGDIASAAFVLPPANRSAAVAAQSSFLCGPGPATIVGGRRLAGNHHHCRTHTISTRGLRQLPTVTSFEGDESEKTEKPDGGADETEKPDSGAEKTEKPDQDDKQNATITLHLKLAKGAKYDDDEVKKWITTTDDQIKVNVPENMLPKKAVVTKDEGEEKLEQEATEASGKSENDLEKAMEDTAKAEKEEMKGDDADAKKDEEAAAQEEVKAVKESNTAEDDLEKAVAGEVAPHPKCCKCKSGSIAWSASGSCSPCKGEIEEKADVPAGCNQAEDDFKGNKACAGECKSAFGGGGGDEKTATGPKCCKCKGGSIAWSASGSCSPCKGEIEEKADVPSGCNQNEPEFKGNKTCVGECKNVFEEKKA